MKTFKANEELIEVLKKNNFIETSSKTDINKGKKKFKLSKLSKKQIYFDYINIVIYDGFHGQEERLSLNENELKILILYFKLKSSDVKEITRDFSFNYGKAIECFEYLKDELEHLKSISSKKLRVNKLERIVEIYNGIKI